MLFEEAKKLINKELLENLYTNKLYSVLECAKELNVSVNMIKLLIKEYNLTRDDHLFRQRINKISGSKEFEKIKEKITKDFLYQYYIIEDHGYSETIEKLGKPVVMPDYSVYSGVWYTILPAYMERFYPREDNYFKLEIDSEGRISGCLRESESPLTKDSYAELSGKIEEDKGIIMYQDDGYGHDGVIEVSFFENGIKVYVTEGGEPNGHGFYTVRYYFNKN